MAEVNLTAQQVKEQWERFIDMEIYLKELADAKFYDKGDSEPETIGPLFARESLRLHYEVSEFLLALKKQIETDQSGQEA